MKVIKINKVKNYKMIRVGNFVLKEDWKEFYKKYNKKLDIIKVFENWIIEKRGNIIKLEYDENIKEEILNNEQARIYFFTINNKIVKIGGSINRGGIRGTLSFYENALTGSPGRGRFIIHLLIAKKLSLKPKNKIEVYFTFLPTCYVKYKPLSEYKIFEERCLEEFKNLLGRYPDWNFQENKEPYPENLEKLYNKYQRKVRKK